MTTRDRIIDTAEVLFATQGFGATTMRQITAAADVNIAAVNYHFGSKENLLAEILDRIVVPLNEERISLLDAAEAAGTPDVTAVLTAFLLPDLHTIERLRARHPDLPRFVSRVYSENSEIMAALVGRQFAETQRRFYSAFSAALPQLSTGDLAWRLHCVVGIVLYLFAGVEVPGVGRMLGDDVDSNLRRLLTVTIPLMTAPREEHASIP